MESDASYKIFRKEADNTTVLFEAVKGLDEAQRRIQELNGPGLEEYFIYDPEKANVIEPEEPTVIKDPFAP